MRKILVALDDSRHAPLVLDKACELAQQMGASLVLFRAVGIPDALPAEAYALSPEEVAKLVYTRAESELSELQKAVPPGVPSEITVEVARAHQGICAAAEHQGVDLIVIGSHGFAGLDHVLGTTAAKVVNHARQSVLVVR